MSANNEIVVRKKKRVETNPFGKEIDWSRQVTSAAGGQVLTEHEKLKNEQTNLVHCNHNTTTLVQGIFERLALPCRDTPWRVQAYSKATRKQKHKNEQTNPFRRNRHYHMLVRRISRLRPPTIGYDV